jgi:cytochrome c oxidase cbb3-type subunit 3
MSDDSKNQTQEEMSGHNYDGITELDNPMPEWWMWTFLFTVMFAALYFIHYQFGGGPTLREELAAQMQEVESHKAPEPVETEETLLAAMAKPDAPAKGATVFASYCASCHGAELQGQIGPNLTDEY